MSIPPVPMIAFDFFEPLPIQVEVSDAPLTSDAGLLPLRQFDERIGLTTQSGAVAAGDRRATAGSLGSRTSGGAGRPDAKAVSERPSSRGPAGNRATSYLAALAH